MLSQPGVGVGPQPTLTRIAIRGFSHRPQQSLWVCYLSAEVDPDERLFAGGAVDPVPRRAHTRLAHENALRRRGAAIIDANRDRAHRDPGSSHAWDARERAADGQDADRPRTRVSYPAHTAHEEGA